MSSRISVLLPVKDAATTLAAALDSLCRQTFTEFTVLAVDDGSTDASSTVLREHASRDQRLIVLENRGDGIIDALETARKQAQTPYLARMDADDLCHPERFEKQLALLESDPELAAVGCQVKLFPRGSLGPGWRRYEAWINGLITPEDHQRECFVESPLAHPSVMMRSEAVESVGGYEEHGWAEDYDLWLRITGAGWKLAKVPEQLLEWRHTEERHSMTSSRYYLEAFQDTRAHYLARHPLLTPGRIAIAGAGKTGRGLGKRLRTHGIEIVCYYDVDPRKVGKLVDGVPIRAWKQVEPPGEVPLVAAVGAPGARALIRPEAKRAGYIEGVDLIFAA